jgi:hypothetical protein
MGVFFRAGLALLAAFVLVACDEGAAEVYLRAQQARQANDRPAYLACFTAKTRDLLRRLDEVAEESKRQLVYFKDAFTLLPDEPVAAPAEVDGDLARLTVGSGRREVEVILTRVDGEWLIDGLELPGFWDAMEVEDE